MTGIAQVIIDLPLVGQKSSRAEVPLPGTRPCRGQTHQGALLGGVCEHQEAGPGKMH